MKFPLLAATCAAFTTLAALSTQTQAQDFPSKAMNITVPNPPGGQNQIHAQPLSAVLEKMTGQPAPVVNRPGGTGAAGTAFVFNQPPDGHSLLVTTPNIYLAIEKDKLYGVKSPYTLEQAGLIALLSADPLTMAVHPSLPVKSVKEFVALAKSKPGEIVFSSSGPYGITHTPIAMLMDAAGLKMRHLPTTGGGPAIVQVLGGHAQVTASGPGAVYPHVKSGKLRALANWGTKPHPSLPDVQPLKSMGYDMEAYLWVGLFTSAAVPEATMSKLRDLVRKAVNEPAFKTALDNVQVVPDYRDSPDFRKFFDADHKRMAAVVKGIGKI
jgi:tripartite-type tricarboxylate transporter receptor subunit TctC